jgi:serine/threonine protein kinase
LRFQCTFCLSLISVDDPEQRQINCSSCGKKCFVPSSPFEPSCIINDFIIKEKIGRGSIGTVFKAIQISLDRPVALKVLAPEFASCKGVAAFLNEAKAAAALSHPNLVQALAVGEEDGICYFAMSYIDGVTLTEYIERQGDIAPDEALHIVQQVAESLYYAWDEARIIHRDVKPDNIMITREGVVKLTDLGLAMRQKDWCEEMEISGSPAYMSPEQFAGEPLDTRSDIYSLGISFYQMLTGILPFCGETFKSIAREHFDKRPTPVRELNADVPIKVSEILKKMIAKLPEDRYPDMESLLRDIWNARQKTAPNLALVPDVHTISINKLDYDLQTQSVVQDLEVQRQVQSLKRRRDIFFWSLLVIIPVLTAILLIFAFTNPLIIDTEYETLRKKYEAFQQMVRGSSDPSMIEVHGRNFLVEFPMKRSDRVEALYWKTRYMVLSNLLRKSRMRIDKQRQAIIIIQQRLEILVTNQRKRRKR